MQQVLHGGKAPLLYLTFGGSDTGSAQGISVPCMLFELILLVLLDRAMEKM